MLCPTNSLPRGFFSAHSPLHTLLPSISLVSPRLNSHASCLDTAFASPLIYMLQIKICLKPALFVVVSLQCSTHGRCLLSSLRPDRGLHHLTNPMHALSPPYPNRIALDICQSLDAPSTRSTTTPPQQHIQLSGHLSSAPPPSTGALTRLQRNNVSDIGGIPAFDTTPLDTCTPAGSRVS